MFSRFWFSEQTPSFQIRSRYHHNKVIWHSPLFIPKQVPLCTHFPSFRLVCLRDDQIGAAKRTQSTTIPSSTYIIFFHPIRRSGHVSTITKRRSGLTIQQLLEEMRPTNDLPDQNLNLLPTHLSISTRMKSLPRRSPCPILLPTHLTISSRVQSLPRPSPRPILILMALDPDFNTATITLSQKVMHM